MLGQQEMGEASTTSGYLPSTAVILAWPSMKPIAFLPVCQVARVSHRGWKKPSLVPSDPDCSSAKRNWREGSAADAMVLVAISPGLGGNSARQPLKAKL